LELIDEALQLSELLRTERALRRPEQLQLVADFGVQAAHRAQESATASALTAALARRHLLLTQLGDCPTVMLSQIEQALLLALR
jgi:hypothetical protein